MDEASKSVAGVLVACGILASAVVWPIVYFNLKEDERMTAAGFVWVPTMSGHWQKVEASTATEKP